MQFSLDTIISFETLQKINIYKTLLRDWNRRTALVQEDTLEQFEFRHVIDSLQIIPIIQEISKTILLNQRINDPSPLNNTDVKESPFLNFVDRGFRLDQPHEDIRDLSIIDVGSGAGFPGMIMSICGFTSVTLCESNIRKCIFLEEVARQTHTQVRILNQRVERVDEKFDIVVSRACANLNTLLESMNTITKGNYTYGIFHKGRSWEFEVSEARRYWDFCLENYKSVSSIEGVILACLFLKTK